MMTSVKNGFMPPAFVSNLQDVLKNRKSEERPKAEEVGIESPAQEKSSGDDVKKNEDLRPVVLVTNEDGIEAPGLRCLVEALISGGRFNVNVCAPESDKSGIGHGVTLRQTVAVSTVDIKGATAYEVSVAGAREALISGVPSIAISLNWKKDESKESDFKEAAEVCLPLIYAAVQDIEKDLFLKGCLLNVDIPTRPSVNKGFKVTRQSTSRLTSSWQPVTLQRHLAGQYMSKEQSLGIQLAQLSRAASAAGAARRLNSLRKNIEVESVAESGKPETQSGAVKKYVRVEFSDHKHGEMDDDLDHGALEQGFITITPLGIACNVEPDTHSSAATWITTAIGQDLSTSL